MEEKLREYRARRRKEETVSDDPKKTNPLNMSMASSQVDSIPSDTESLLSNSSSSTCVEGSEEKSTLTRTDIVLYVALGAFWLTVYIIAIYYEFGAVFFVVSLLFFIWKNTRTGPKKNNEISAYSVFNPNCEAIDGTISAEQFEREIRFGPASVH